ncbi:MAG: hypothetical protein AB7G75_21760 [Candidatus Binatia bacterium]
MKRFFFGMVILLLSHPSFAWADGPQAVPTFESLGLYWSPAAGSTTNTCHVSYRRTDSTTWKDGLPLWFDERNGEYRGSLVHLTPGTTYEIKLRLQETTTETTLTATTWRERLPIAQRILLPETSSDPLIIDQSGTPNGYILYTHPPGGSATIDVAGNYDHGIEVRASYIIIRGVTIKNTSVHGIRLYAEAHDVVIEDNDISGWGRIDSDGWGVDWDSAIYSQASEVERIIIQHNVIHHPRADSNNWTEWRAPYNTYHPRGPQAVTLVNSAGNHVIRYNEVFSDPDHYFNDIFGAGANFSTVGFPNRDTDIYGNHLRHCWDDAIESEGGNRNVRIWNNFIEWTFTKVAVAPTSLGPIYIWRNVAGVARQNDAQPWVDMPRGGFLKTTTTEPSGGKIYMLHNSLLQPPPAPGDIYPWGCSVGIGHGGLVHNVTSRNNILHVYKYWWESILLGYHPLNDYDFDLYNGVIPTEELPAGVEYESNGIAEIPVYSPPPSFSLVNGEGVFTLDPLSPGYDAGERIANFNDGYIGTAPDIGAHEAGTAPMRFGRAASPPLVAVGLDIKPGSEANCLQMNGHGVIPVAILGRISFAVNHIDVPTLRFAGLSVRVKGNGSPQCAVDDVSGDVNVPQGAPDGYPDLVCQFVDDPTHWAPGEGIATLTGALHDGTPIEGIDSICIVP